jgi:rhamnulokinase
MELFVQALDGIGRAADRTQLSGVGVDGWGVDYALLDASGRLLGLPFHYRDSRTAGMVARAHDRISRQELYAISGVQTIAINTVFQLLADERSSAALDVADRIALLPDLFSFWLTGELANEATIASTTGLLEARTGRWAVDAIGRLGLPARPFAGDPLEPGRVLGTMLADHARLSGRAVGVPVHAVASHDTASAFVGTPLANPRSAILSAGTWSLLGLERDEPILSADACAANLSNERGVDRTIRLLANVMGLWLVQECRRHWGCAGDHYEYAELLALAEASRASVPVFDPDDLSLLAPGDMPARIASACAAGGQVAPETPGEFVRSALLSLACKSRLVLERLERVTGTTVEVVHVIGGGSRNELLCRLSASVLGRPVLAGPVEATAMGNVLVQAWASGQLGSLADCRALSAVSTEPRLFEPGSDRARAEDDYGRFLEVTGLAAAGDREPAPA